METAYERHWEPRRKRKRDAETRADGAGEKKEIGYYGLPVIHAPEWDWLIVAYFYFGGIAGASYALASIAELLGGEENRRLARTGRYLALAATLPCPPLLILDLGRPGRFHHMLRVVKIQSPMSVGTWTLLAHSLGVGLSVVAQAAEDGLLGDGRIARLGRALPAKAIGAAGLAPSFFFGGYTGTLVGVTAVPLWARNVLLLGPLFLASAVSTASAALGLLLSAQTGTRRETLARLESLETVAQLAEAVLMVVTEARLGPTLGRPLHEGKLGLVHRFGAIGAGLVAPLGLRVLRRLGLPLPERAATVVSGLLTLGGGLLFRYTILYGGLRSAEDPVATFELTGTPDD